VIFHGCLHDPVPPRPVPHVPAPGGPPAGPRWGQRCHIWSSECSLGVAFRFEREAWSLQALIYIAQNSANWKDPLGWWFVAHEPAHGIAGDSESSMATGSAIRLGAAWGEPRGVTGVAVRMLRELPNGCRWLAANMRFLACRMLSRWPVAGGRWPVAEGPEVQGPSGRSRGGWWLPRVRRQASGSVAWRSEMVPCPAVASRPGGPGPPLSSGCRSARGAGRPGARAWSGGGPGLAATVGEERPALSLNLSPRLFILIDFDISNTYVF
jgi:hypothetical protein